VKIELTHYCHSIQYHLLSPAQLTYNSIYQHMSETTHTLYKI